MNRRQDRYINSFISRSNYNKRYFTCYRKRLLNKGAEVIFYNLAKLNMKQCCETRNNKGLHKYERCGILKLNKIYQKYRV